MSKSLLLLLPLLRERKLLLLLLLAEALLAILLASCSACSCCWFRCSISCSQAASTPAATAASSTLDNSSQRVDEKLTQRHIASRPGCQVGTHILHTMDCHSMPKPPDDIISSQGWYEKQDDIGYPSIAGPAACKQCQNSCAATARPDLYAAVVAATYSGPFNRPSILKQPTPAAIMSGSCCRAIRSWGLRR
jgi:hypothetical protein